MGKYIIRLERGETAYKTVNSNGKPMIQLLAPTPYTEPDLEQVRKEAYEEGYAEGSKEDYDEAYLKGYNQGLADAWDTARKIRDMTCTERREVFGTDIYTDIIALPASEAIEKIRQYEQEKEEKITNGDVVRIKSAPEVEILVTYADESHVSGIALTEVDGSCEIGDQYTDIIIHKVEKTGRHYEIAEVLKKMREE